MDWKDKLTNDCPLFRRAVINRYSGGSDNDGWAKLRWENEEWVIETVEDGRKKSDVQWYSYPVIVLPLNSPHPDSGS